MNFQFLTIKPDKLQVEDLIGIAGKMYSIDFVEVRNKTVHITYTEHEPVNAQDLCRGSLIMDKKTTLHAIIRPGN